MEGGGPSVRRFRKFRAYSADVSRLLEGPPASWLVA